MVNMAYCVEQKSLFLQLPVELLCQICDYLDIKTIIFSFRYVCRDFYRITNHYNRYKLHLNTILDYEFNHIVQIIRPENVISLHLWCINQNLIESFFSLFEIKEFLQLEFLTIWNLDEFYLKQILSHLVTTCHLRSFSIYSLQQINISDEILNLLFKLFLQSSLRSVRLMFNIKQEFSSSSLEIIHLNICTDKQLISIINNCPNLRRLSLYDCQMNSMEHNFISNSLTHLTFYQTKLTIDQLEFILYFTPLLTHLYIRNSKSRFDCFQRLSQWENFIQKNLVYLYKFQFSLTCEDFHINHIETLINAFRSSFWLEEKSWPIICEVYNWSQWSELTIYSSTNVQTFFPHHCNYKTIFCSTSTMSYNNQITLWNVFLTANHNAFHYGIEWYKSRLSPFVNNIAELALQIDEISSIQSLKYFLTISNIFNFVHNIWIVIDGYEFNCIEAIQSLLCISTYFHSLGICYRYGCLKTMIDKIFTGLNIRINQLKIKTDDLDFMKWIIQRIQNVENFKFLHYYPLPMIWMELIEWLTFKQEKFTFEQDQYSLTISFHSRTIKNL
ncbi:hypothetical protein I4U23_031395 [Adineta vaga]|nr:hypothetical protein I4U23_031395 [Adineta vaga]